MVVCALIIERVYLKNAIVAGNKWTYNSSKVILSFLVALLTQRSKEKNDRITGCLKLCTWALPYKAINPFICILWPALRSFPSMFIQIDCSQSMRMVFPTMIIHVILLTTVYFFSFTRVVVPSVTYLWLILFITKSECFGALSPPFCLCSFEECIF